jgi:calcineurin-like phosphoesterase family protein
MVYVTADTHFGDENILRFEGRPFSSVKEMDEALIHSWNVMVKEEDEIWHLGDFSIPGMEEYYLKQLHGKIFLIKGNHDLLSNEEYRKMGFAEVYDHPVILDGFWMMSHEPLYVTRNAPYANVFGHVHGSPQYMDVSERHFIACVERTGYKPLPLEEVKRMVQTEE